MFLTIFIGTGLIVVGVLLVGMVLQFYMGQRRDLYFQSPQAWIGSARLGGASLLFGVGLFSLQLFDPDLAAIFMSFAAGVAILWWMSAPLLLRWLPPPWVRDFERQHSAEDLQAIRQNGAAMLHLYPKLFPRLIAHRVGWETWLLTVTDMIPLVSLEVYAKRAEQALQNRLYAVAIEAAATIIQYRPDQPSGYHLRGRAYAGKHQYAEAIADYQAAITLQSENAELHIQRGRLYLLIHHYPEALHDFQQAARLAPMYPGLMTLIETARQSIPT